MIRFSVLFLALTALVLSLSSCGGGEPGADGELNADIKSASSDTKAHNRDVSRSLPFKDRTYFELATRGFIARLPGAVVRDSEGKEIYGQLLDNRGKGLYSYCNFSNFYMRKVFRPRMIWRVLTAGRWFREITTIRRLKGDILLGKRKKTRLLSLDASYWRCLLLPRSGLHQCS